MKKKKKKKTKKKKEDSDRDTKTTVTIPYIKMVSEALSWVFCYHSVMMVMKPCAHLTVTRMLVHSKDNRTPQDPTGECRGGVPGPCVGGNMK